MDKKRENKLINMYVPVDLLDMIEDRISDFGHNKNHYINSIVVEFLTGKGYKVKMYQENFSVRKNPRNGGNVKRNKNNYIPFRLTKEADEALKLEAEKDTRSPRGLIRHLINQDISAEIEPV